MPLTRKPMLLGVGTALLIGCAAGAADIAGQSASETKPPFGGPANIGYAEALWSALAEARLVGEDTFRATPYEGRPPHGGVLVTLEGDITVGDHTGIALVKKNYRGESGDSAGEQLSVDRVADEPDRYLASITVMYRREAGYDADHDNWYWAKYNPDGTLQSNPKDMKLAGRVAKGADQGCIACHAPAPGGDYVFTHDRLASE